MTDQQQSLSPPLTEEQIADNEAAEARANGLSWFMPIQRLTREEMAKLFPPKEKPQR